MRGIAGAVVGFALSTALLRAVQPVAPLPGQNPVLPCQSVNLQLQ
jgi:hypothetical protein